MNRIFTVHRFTWLNAGRAVLAVVGLAALAICAIALMAAGSRLVDLLQL